MTMSEVSLAKGCNPEFIHNGPLAGAMLKCRDRTKVQTASTKECGQCKVVRASNGRPLSYQRCEYHRIQHCERHKPARAGGLRFIMTGEFYTGDIAIKDMVF